MVYPSGLLIHSAQFESGETLSASDEYGAKTPTKTYTTVSCRFGKARSSWQQMGDPGRHIVTGPTCIVPMGTAVVEGRLFVGLTAPYNKTYRIMAVTPAGMAMTISHLVLDLEAIDG